MPLFVGMHILGSSHEFSKVRLATTIVYLNVYAFPLGIWYGFGSTYRVLQWFPAHRAKWSS